MRLLLVLLFLLCACGRDAGGLPSRDGGVAHVVEPGSSPLPPPDAADPRVAKGGELYAKYCALCHGPEGQGYAADNAPSLVSDTFLASATDAFLIQSIAIGRPGTAMAPYSTAQGGPLTTGDIRSIVAWMRRSGPAQRPLAATRRPGDATRGHAVYTQHCASCHGTRDERGQAPHLANPAFLDQATDAFIRHAIVEGRPGAGAGELVMPAWKTVLTEQQIDDVVTYVRAWQPAKVAPAPPTPPRSIPKDLPIVTNPKGKHASFTLRDGRFVAADDVKRALDEKRRIVLLDARPTSEWLRAHIPGAVPMPHYQMDRADEIPKDGTWIVAYCACPHHASGEVVDELRKRGYKNTAVLDEGVLVWQKRGYPVVPAE